MSSNRDSWRGHCPPGAAGPARAYHPARSSRCHPNHSQPRAPDRRIFCTGTRGFGCSPWWPSRQATCSAGWVRGLPRDQADHTIWVLSRGVTSGDRPVRGRTAGFRDTVQRAAHTAGMPVRLRYIVVDAHDLPGLARFWTQAPGWQVLSEREDEIVIGTGENSFPARPYADQPTTYRSRARYRPAATRTATSRPLCRSPTTSATLPPRSSSPRYCR